MIIPQTLEDMLDCYDYSMLADVIEKEARGEPFEGMAAVGEVVLKRLQLPQFPNTISGVVLQRMQFSAYNKGDANRERRPSVDDPVYRQCCKAALAAMASARNGDWSYSGEADHYLNEAATRAGRKRAGLAEPMPRWFRESKVTKRIHRHTFLKLH